nr:unnamed protein product [Naegleria fowleri]
MKKAIIQEWSILDLNVKLHLSQYIFEYITSVVLGGRVPCSTTPGVGSIKPPSILQQIVNQLLQSYAIIQKRSWIDEEGGGSQFREMTYKHIQQLLNLDNQMVQQKSQNLALQLLLSLITEFSLGGSSSEIGMNWEFHEKSRILFQQDFLPNCFGLGIDILKRSLSIRDESLFFGRVTNEDVSELLKMSVNALDLIREVLCWDFSPFNEVSSLKSIISTKMYKNKYASSGGGAGSASIEQGKINPNSKEWKERFTNTEILNMFIQLHQKFRQGLMSGATSSNALEAELFIRITHQVRLCLTQWCNISNECFENDKMAKLNFFVGLLSSIFALMGNALQTYTSLEFSLICGQEIYDCTQCIYRLFINFGFLPFIEIYQSQTNQAQFFEIMQHLTQATIRTMEISSKFNDQFIVDGLTTLLGCWSIICESIATSRLSVTGSYLDAKGADFVRQCCFEIFKSYVNLKVPDQRPVSNNEDDEDEEDDNDELFVDEQLNAMGIMGRQFAEPSLQLLNHKFSTRFSQLQSLFGQSFQTSRALDNLWEDFEWIIEIAGYVVADDAEGETPTLPPEIVDLTNDDTEDNIFFTFVNGILKFSQFELLCLSKSPQMLSPRISKTLMWFFWRWGQSYLMPEVSHYTESISRSILAMYGEKSENGVKVVDYLLQKISHNLAHWSAEHDTCQETIKLFIVMSKKKSIQRCVVKTNTFAEIVKNDFNTFNTLHKAPNWVKGKLTQCIISCCPSFIKVNEEGQKNFDELHHVLNLVLVPLRDQFNSILAKSDFHETYQQAQVMEQLDYCFEKFLGIAKGSTNPDIASTMVQFFNSEQILVNLVKLMHQYYLHEQFVTLIIRVFKSCIKAFVNSITKDQCKSLFSIALSMIQTFTQIHSKKNGDSSQAGGSKHRRPNALDELSEEERYKDLLLILKMLTCMISRDFLDFSEDGSSAVFSAEVRVKTDTHTTDALVNYVFQGIHLMLPLITIDLLDFAPLRKQYFRLISFMMEMYPEKVTILPQPLFNHFISALVFGLGHFELDIAQESFDAIHALSSFRSQYPNSFDLQDQSFVGMLIKECVNMLLYETFDIELLHNISDTLFGLILWDQNSYRMVVESILQNEPSHAQDIAKGFQYLDNGITEMTLQRRNMVKFYENLEKVIPKIRCFTRRK